MKDTLPLAAPMSLERTCYACELDKHFSYKAIFLGCMSLDCFKCISTAGHYPPCDDPFHNNYTHDILETPCWAGRKQRNGVFPATTCVKLAGVYGMYNFIFNWS